MLQRLKELAVRRWLNIKPLSRYRFLCALAICLYATAVLLPWQDKTTYLVYGRYNAVTDTITVYPEQMAMAAARGYYVPTMEEVIRHEEIHKSQRIVLLFALLLALATPVIIGLMRLTLGLSAFFAYQSIINITELTANLFSGPYSGLRELLLVYTFWPILFVALTLYLLRLSMLEARSRDDLVAYIDGRLGLPEQRIIGGLWR